MSVRLLQIVGSLFTALCTLSFGLERSAPGAARWLPPSGSKRSGDLLALALSPLWIASVGAPSSQPQLCLWRVAP